MSWSPANGHETRTFDLKELNDRFRSKRRGPRVTGLAMVSIIAAICAIVIVARWGRIVSAIFGLTPLAIAWIVAFAAAAGMVVLGVSLFIIASPDLGSVTLDENGLVLSFGSGKSRSYRWDDPRLHLVIEDFQGRVPSGWGPPIALQYLSLPRGPTRMFSAGSALTEEAFRALLETARIRSLTISQRTGMGGFGPSPLIYDIRHSRRS